MTTLMAGMEALCSSLAVKRLGVLKLMLVVVCIYMVGAVPPQQVENATSVMSLAQQLGRLMENCALGQGQAPRAESMIENGLKNGSWILLANCHLMLSWSGTLEEIIENYANSAPGEIHDDYRLAFSP